MGDFITFCKDFLFDKKPNEISENLYYKLTELC